MTEQQRKLMDNHLQVYKGRPDLTIDSQAHAFVSIVPGRGPTHIEAYKEGAKFLARLIKEGLVSPEELDKL